MRRGFFFLLMVVLVLRGFTGTAMAAGIVAPLLPAGPVLHTVAPLHNPQLVNQAQPDELAPGMLHEHHGDHGTAATADDVAAPSAACVDDSAGCDAHDHHSATCSACEICHSAMLGLPASLIPLPLPAGAQLPPAVAQFDSAPAALVIKPPIA